MNCFLFLIGALALVLAIAAFRRNRPDPRLERLIHHLRMELESLKLHVRGQENLIQELERKIDVLESRNSKIPMAPLPKESPSIELPPPILPPPLPLVAPLPAPERPPIEPVQPLLREEPLEQAIVGVEEEPYLLIGYKELKAVEAETMPQPRSPEAAVSAISPPPVPVKLPPALQTPLPAKAKRSWEDFLGAQLFLRAGVVTLLLGVVLVMGLAFKQMGPLGKVLMGYFGGSAMLAGGFYAEKRERYQTFGRALIAGALGILYFVTFAAGFFEASRIFEARPTAILALLVAGSAIVAFSLRYRNEWTTTSAFLLIYHSLGMSAWKLDPAFNLTAVGVVSLALSFLVWRMRWVRLLGLGVPATWATLAFWMLFRPHPAPDPGLVTVLGFCWAASQGAVLLWRGNGEEHRRWLAAAQVANFLGAFGLSLHHALRTGASWSWRVALLYGLLHLLVGVLLARQNRRGLYLLSVTEGLAALALAGPLRLGWTHQLLPIYRLMGLEVLLAAGIFLKERYFRILAYGAFALTFFDILGRCALPGADRLFLATLGASVMLANALLIRGPWRKTCAWEIPAMPALFACAGTLLAWVALALKWDHAALAASFGALACLWLLYACLWGAKDFALLGSGLGILASLSSTFWILKLSHDPTRWKLSLLTLLFLGGSYGILRSQGGRSLPEAWKTRLSGLLSVLLALPMAAQWAQDLPHPWVGPALAATGLLWLLGGLGLGFKELFLLSFVWWPAALIGSTLLAWHSPARIWNLLFLALTALLSDLMLHQFRTEVFSAKARSRGAAFHGLVAAFFLLLLIYVEAEPAWVSPLLLVLAWLQWCRARLQPSALHAFIGLIVGSLGLLAVITHSWSLHGQWGLLPLRAASMMASLLLCALTTDLLRRIQMEEGSAPCLKELLPTWLLPGWAACLSIAGSLLSMTLMIRELPQAWIAPMAMTAACLHLGWLLHRSHGDSEGQHRSSTFSWLAGLGYLALGFLAILQWSWDARGSVWVLSARLLSAGWSLGLALLAESLLRRASVMEFRERRARALRLSAGILLTPTALVLLALLRAEAAQHLAWVAPLWGLAGLGALGRAWNLKSLAWLLHGHTLLLLAFLHCMAFTLDQGGPFPSQRLLASLSLGVLLGLAYRLNSFLVPRFELKEEYASFNTAYLWACHLLGVLLLLSELPLSWILPSWATLSLGFLLWGLWRERSSWIISGLILSWMTLLRGLMTLGHPASASFMSALLASLLLVAAYAMIRLASLRTDLVKSLGWSAHRLAWFPPPVLLFWMVVWMEISGTQMTVWFSLQGLGLVILGFGLRERASRLTGLGLLCFCILKLFFHDLRGLSGLSLALAALVLGLVLIAVSWGYARFVSVQGGPPGRA